MTLSDEVHRNLLLLLRPEIVKCFKTIPFSNLTKLLGHILSEWDINYADKVLETGGVDEAVTSLVNALIKSRKITPTKAWNCCVKIAASRANVELQNRLNLVGVRDLKHYVQVLEAYPMLVDLISQSMILNLAQKSHSNECLTDQALTAVEQICKQKKITPEHIANALKIFVLDLPLHNDDWYWTFMDSFDEEDVELMELRTYINGDYVAEKTKHLEQLEKAKALMQAENDTKDCDVENSNKTQTDSTSDSESSDDEAEQQPVKRESLELRGYQIELMSAAVNGKNTIICAPTGSGKTIVAVEIVRRHFYHAKGRKRKVAFLVPTVNLVQQQTQVFKRYMYEHVKVKGLEGGQIGWKQKPKSSAVPINDVLIMTPQILLNMLTAPSTASGPIPISTFSLIIFDECHHTDKMHPYHEIMLKYFECKAADDLNIDPPQIVGLTASVGVGGAVELSHAKAHILRICARMDASVLSTIDDEDNLEELARYVNVPTDVLERVASRAQNDPFISYVSRLMVKMESMIKNDLDELENMPSASQNVQYCPPEKKYGRQYDGWLNMWLHFVPTLYDADRKRRLTTVLEYLKALHEALDLNLHVPANQAIQFLMKEFACFHRNQNSPLEATLLEMYEKELAPHLKMGGLNNGKNAMTEKLKEILLKEFTTCSDGRCLIFVRTRVLTSALSLFINGDTALRHLSANRLTGVCASRERGGQSEKEQRELLRKFENGEHKVMVATSVAEEGLDIAKCNLIIKYNYVTNEIALVQRKGRGRASGSRSILLVQDGLTEEQEIVNMIRERLMAAALEFIGNMGTAWFADEIKKLQIQAEETLKIAKNEVDIRRRQIGDSVYELLCVKCSSILIESTFMRRMANSHYVAADPKVWEKVIPSTDHKPVIYDNVVNAARLQCMECRTPCGSVFKYANVYLPTLKAESVLQRRQTDGSLFNLGQWKKITEKLFIVEEIEEETLRIMFRALKPVLTRRLDEQCRMAAREERQSKRGPAHDAVHKP